MADEIVPDKTDSNYPDARREQYASETAAKRLADAIESDLIRSIYGR